MNQLARCMQCGKPFIKTRASKLYCDIICTDKAAHAKARARAKLGREEIATAEQLRDLEKINRARAELEKESQNKPTVGQSLISILQDIQGKDK